MIPRVFEAGLDAYPSGPSKLLLKSGPGCGKTTTVVKDFILPALKLGIEPKSILSCSFTRAAAGELRDRVSKYSGIDTKHLYMTCSTLHAEALRLYRSTGAKIKVIGDDTEENEDGELVEGPASRFNEEFFGGMDSDEKGIYKKALSLWEYSRNVCVFNYMGPEFSVLFANLKCNKSITEFQDAIKRYEEHKKNNGLIDFTDMLYYACKITPPNRELVIVDEAQDCSSLQWKLLENWFTTAKRVMIVGDFDQTIHEWCGSDPKKMDDLIKKNFTLLRLGKSYRVPKRVHALARKVILKNTDRIDMPYEPKFEDGFVAKTTIDTAIDELRKIYNAGKEAFVLARTRGILDENWIHALNSSGIPYINERGFSPYNAPNLIKAAKSVMAIREDRHVMGGDLSKLIDKLPGRDVRFFKKGVTKKSVTGWLLSNVDTPISNVDLDNRGVLVDHIKAADLKELFTEMKFEVRAEILANLIKNYGAKILDGKTKIILTSGHGSKGREADLVIVDTTIPKACHMRVWRDANVANAERRVFYVAITRTKNTLLLYQKSKSDYLKLSGVDNV